MSIVELMRRMRELGAPPEAIELAVEAIEAEQQKDADRRAKRAAQKAKERAGKSDKGGDSRATVARQGGDSRSDLPSDGSPQDNITQPPSLPPHSSDPDGSALPAGSASLPVSILDQIWNTKASLADLSGKPEQSVGRWIGKALKDHPPDVVKQGIDAALHAGTRDPFSYARSVMLNAQGNANAQQGNRNGRTHSDARSQGTAARVAAIMGYDPEPDVHGSQEERRLPRRTSWSEGRDNSRIFDAEPDAAGVYRA